MKCLLVVDVQNGFISSRTEYVVPRIRALLSQFYGGLILASKFVNTENSPFTKIIHWNRLKYSPETDLDSTVEQNTQIIIEKTTYSACTDAFFKAIQDKAITEVFIAGIDTDCCVLKTAIDLFECNIRPIVLADYCASNGGKESHEAAIRVLSRTIGTAQIYIGDWKG